MKRVRWICTVLLVLILSSIWVNTGFADADKSSYADYPNYKFHSRWEFWSQCDSSLKIGSSSADASRLYGCFTMAYSKLMAEAGIVPSGFEPDDFILWMSQKGYLDKTFNETNPIDENNYVRGDGLIAYAKEVLGVTIIRKETKSFSDSSIAHNKAKAYQYVQDQLNKGYYVILYFKDRSGKTWPGNPRSNDHAAYVMQGYSTQAGNSITISNSDEKRKQAGTYFDKDKGKYIDYSKDYSDVLIQTYYPGAKSRGYSHYFNYAVVFDVLKDPDEQIVAFNGSNKTRIGWKHIVQSTANNNKGLVRKSPHDEGEVVATLDNGTEVFVEESGYNTKGKLWYKLGGDYRGCYIYSGRVIPADAALYHVSGTSSGSLAINSIAKSGYQIGSIPENGTCLVDMTMTSGNWYYVLYNGVTGYAHSKYLQPHNNPTSSGLQWITNLVPNTYYVSGTRSGSLAINSQASSGYEIASIPEGAACDVYLTKTIGDWYYVKYNGVSGYAHSAYLTDIPPSVNYAVYYVAGTSSGSLAINSQASSGYEIASIPEGAACVVNLNKTIGNWYYVNYNGYTGYAHSSYLTANQPAENNKTYYVSGTSGSLAINSQPSSGYEIGSIPEGEACVADLNRTSGNWYWVTYNGVSGYSYKNYLSENAPVSNYQVHYVSGTRSGSLAINSQPSSGYEIASIPEGAACVADLNKTNGNWYWVIYNGVSGYAYKTYLTTTKPAENLEVYYVSGTNSGSLAINSKAQAGYQIGSIPEGAACQVDLSKTLGNWYWVTYNGCSGYSYKSYLTTVPMNPNNVVYYVSGTSSGALAINSQASAGYEIANIPEGASCIADMNRVSGNWYWVTYNGVSGYSYNRYLTTEAPQTQTAYVVGTSSGYLAINSRPQAGYEISNIPEGGCLTVYTNRTNGNWYWVCYNGVYGYSYNRYISFNAPDIRVSGISLEASDLLLGKGMSQYLKVNIEPQTATNKDLIWHSSDNSIVTVTDGLITAIGGGRATISCIAQDGSGMAASCNVTVYPVVSFNSNGGACNTFQISVIVGERYGELPVPVLGGNVFKGWYSAFVGGERITENTAVTNSSDHTLYARWEKIRSSGLKTAPMPEGDYYIVSALNEEWGNVNILEDSVNAGMRAVLWKKNEGGSGQFRLKAYGDDFYIINNNSRLCLDVSMSDTYLVDNQSVEQQSISAVIDDSELWRFEKSTDGYYFIQNGMGTYLSVNSIGDTSNGKEICTNTFTGGLEQKFRLVSVNSQSLLLDADGGTVEDINKTIAFGERYGDLPIPVKEGFAFTGWFSDSGERIDYNSTVNTVRDVTLYAGWTELKTSNQPVEKIPAGNYYLSSSLYDTQTVMGVDDATMDFTESVTPFENKYSSALQFDISAQSGSYVIANNYSGGYIMVDDGGTSVLTKQNVVCRVIEESALDSGAHWNFEVCADGSYYVRSNSGQYLTMSDEGLLCAEVFSGGAKQKFRLIQSAYNFRYDSNGGTGSMDSLSVNLGDTVVPSQCTFAKEGASFAGWQIRRDVDDTWYCSDLNIWAWEGLLETESCAPSIFDANVEQTLDETWLEGSNGITSYTLVAKWEYNDYLVSFDANGGETATTSKQLAFMDSYGALPEATRMGYVFSGWYTQAEGGTRVLSETVLTTAQNHTLYAHWYLPVNDANFKYSVISDTQAVITAYTGSSAIVQVPSQLGGLNVVAIADGAFRDNKSITEVVIGDGVLEIGEYVFKNCSELRMVSIGSGTQSIGIQCFMGCSKLESVQMPTSLHKISSNAFSSCSLLSDIVLPDNLKIIGGYAFSNCSAIEEINLPEGLEDIGMGAFSDCIKLKQIIVPGSVEILNESIFMRCSSLEKAEIKEGIESTGSNTFYGCNNLNTVILPEGLKEIGGKSFESCMSLATLDLPNGVIKIGSSAFARSGLQEIIFPDTLVSIDETAFSECAALESITLPESLMILERSAFSKCTTLKEVKLPATMKNIGTMVFSQCSALESIVLPEGMKSIGDSTFFRCTSLKNVTLPTTLEKVDGHAFYGCTALECIVIPDDVKEIGSAAFMNCDKLNTVVLPEGLQEIPSSAFSQCVNLKKINIPSSVEVIGSSAFYVCSSLEELVLPEGLKKVGGMAFTSCRSLKEIVLPEQLEVMGENIFTNCFGLTAVVVADSIAAEYCADNNVSCLMLEKVIFDANGGTVDEEFIIVKEGSVYGVLPKPYFPGYTFAGWYSSESDREAVTENTIVSTKTNHVLVAQWEESIFDWTIVNEDEVVITAYHGAGDTIDIPQSIDGFKVVGISPYAFGEYTEADTLLDEIADGSGSVTAMFNLVSRRYSAREDNSIAINIPESMLTIGDNAFRNLNDTAKVYLSDKTTAIGYAAFAGADIKEASLANVKVIGDCAFMGCDAIDSIVIPGNVNYIGNFAFFKCTGIESVLFDNDAPSVGNYAFAWCEKLKKVNLPGKTEVLGKGIFYNCANLQTVTFPNTLKTIGIDAFRGCISLEEIVLPDGLTTIKEGAFQNCLELKSIVIPKGVTSIGEDAFAGCSQLVARVYINSYAESYFKQEGIDIEYIDETYSADGFIYTLADDGATIVGYTGKKANIIVPAKINGVTVVSIGSGAFYNCETVESVEIESGITSIGKTAFSGCINLISLKIPDSVHTMGEDAFAFCKKLIHVELPTGIEKIPEGAFYECTTLKRIVLPNNIRTIERGAFYKCDNLGEIVFMHDSEGVLFIQDAAFYTSLMKTTTIYVLQVSSMNSVISDYDWNADNRSVKFKGETSNLQMFILPQMLVRIEKEAFDSTNVEKIVVPEGCTTIETKAFANNDNLQILIIPNSVISIAEDALLNSDNAIIITESNSFAARWADSKNIEWKEKE